MSHKRNLRFSSHNTRQFQERSIHADDLNNDIDTQLIDQSIHASHLPDFFFHVTHDTHNDKWHVKEVRAKAANIYETRQEAIDGAKELISKTTSGHIVIHKDDGSFELLDYY